jgi:hypothetical protein
MKTPLLFAILFAGCVSADKPSPLKPTRERIDSIPPEFNEFRTTDARPSVPSPSEPAQ